MGIRRPDRGTSDWRISTRENRGGQNHSLCPPEEPQPDADAGRFGPQATLDTRDSFCGSRAADRRILRRAANNWLSFLAFLFCAMRPNFPDVRGVDLDLQTRCGHYHAPSDIIAIKMKCCGVYYACKDCHDVLADHPIEVWPESQWTEQAILCGACGEGLTIDEYMQCQ